MYSERKWKDEVLAQLGEKGIISVNRVLLEAVWQRGERFYSPEAGVKELLRSEHAWGLYVGTDIDDDESKLLEMTSKSTR